MSDLVDRLRASTKSGPRLHEEAAARIERLEAVIRDACEAIERNSTSAPVLESLKAALVDTGAT